MLRNVFIGLLCVSFVAGAAHATIEEWTSVSSGFTFDQYNKTILITAAGTYKFQSYDGETPDDIRWIRVNSGFSGTVTVHVYQDPNDGDGVGAANVKEVDLTETNVTGKLARLYISADLGEEVPGVIVDSVTGDLTIGGSVYNTFDAFLIDTDSTITINGDLHADVYAQTLGDFLVNGAGPHDGEIHMGNCYAGRVAHPNGVGARFRAVRVGVRAFRPAASACVRRRA